MPRLKLTLEYDGAAFSGWAVQPEKLTVQGELKRAFEVYIKSEFKKLGLEKEEDSYFDKFYIQGSGRTDAGVHAKEQVAHLDFPKFLDLDANKIFSSINGILNRSLQIKKIEEVNSDFNARRTPHVKTYSYSFLLRNYSEALEKPRLVSCNPNLNISAMIAAAKQVEGTQDFKSFQASDCNYESSERTIIFSELVRQSDERLVYLVKGKGFLKNMIRIVAGTLVMIGNDAEIISPKDGARRMKEIIAARERGEAGKTVPARALVLEKVSYDIRE